MRQFSCFLILTFTFFQSSLYSQKKILNAVKLTDHMAFDGKINDELREKAPIAKDFIMIAPDNGKPINENKKTEVKVFYDNDAIYISAKMYDNEPGKILKEITQRDVFGTSDHFGIFLNGYNDGQQDFRFFVSAAGVQMDCIYTNLNGEDFTWDAIWQSNVQITDFGWTAEIKIPYAALRFPSSLKQTWGLNFYREIRRDRQQYTWNLIDSKISNECTQSGICEGIENINTPTRLFLIPYSSFYLNGNRQEKTKGQLKGGLDVKYGINDAFTLDAILVPDFGQTKFDNVELNLSPFEQQYSENRPFFTEGTDLFNKGNLLYSRRIGARPSYYPALKENEIYENFPNTISLINALKVSGRTKSGLGIGVLNAVSENTSAIVKDTLTNDKRRQIVSPLTNYNVLVVDQRFHKNSSVAFVNTNVIRDGIFRDANVSAIVFDLNTTKNTYKLSGDYKYSYINEYGNAENKKGYNTSLYLAETSGKYRYGGGGNYISKDFDDNDLGINYTTHFHALYANANYRILNPSKIFNTFQISLDVYSEFDNNTGRIQAGNVNLNLDTTSKKNDYYGFGFNGRPLETYDFYEPRSNDQLKFVTIPENIRAYFYFSSNYNRKFAIDFNPSFSFVNEKGRVNYGLTIAPRYRFNDKFALNYNMNFFRQNKNVGWIAFDDDANTIFSRRDRITYTNTLQGKYSINNKMNINLSVRHYWSYAINHDILTLQDDGRFINNNTYTKNENSNFNSWNVDLSYSWWFAPGSQVSVLYRNSSSIFEREFSREFGTNFNKAIDNENLNHVFSVSFRYFIDYNAIKHIF